MLLLIQEVTVVTGQNRKEHKSSIFYDDGSTCSMVTKDLVARLGLTSVKKRIIMVKSFRHTESINTELVVLELLKEDGTIARVQAYVVDSITEVRTVTIPGEIREEFSASATWPEDRYHGKIEILLGIEELAIQPESMENVGNLGIFKSPLAATTILGGRHKNIFPAQMELSKACTMMRNKTS